MQLPLKGRYTLINILWVRTHPTCSLSVVFLQSLTRMLGYTGDNLAAKKREGDSHEHKCRTVADV
jgi:hypothetical protein